MTSVCEAWSGPALACGIWFGAVVLVVLDVVEVEVDVVDGLVVVDVVEWLVGGDGLEVGGVVVVEVLDVDAVVGGLVDDVVVVGGGSVVAAPAGCGPVAANEVPSARSTRVIVAPKHPPSLATTCTVATGTFSSCAAMPV